MMIVSRSLCPSIYGHELVKAGLILGLFGGTHKFSNDKVTYNTLFVFVIRYCKHPFI